MAAAVARPSFASNYKPKSVSGICLAVRPPFVEIRRLRQHEAAHQAEGVASDKRNADAQQRVAHHPRDRGCEETSEKNPACVLHQNVGPLGSVLAHSRSSVSMSASVKVPLSGRTWEIAPFQKNPLEAPMLDVVTVVVPSTLVSVPS